MRVVHDTAVTRSEHAGVESVWVEHGPRLWRALLAFTGDAELASDAMAEAFAQALGRGTAIRDHERWIWRAAFRIAAGLLKDRGRDTTLAVDLPYEMPEPTIDLVRALQRLPPKQRAVAVLSLYAGMSSGEVASVIAISPATARVHLMQARRRLRLDLEDQS